MTTTKGFLAFMDHSITEQLIGDPTAWHTTAIALSEGDEVSKLARSISRNIFPKQPRLKKWSAGHSIRKKNYRLAFARELSHQLPESPVYLFAISATEEAIEKNIDLILKDLRVSHLYHEVQREGSSPWLRVGPFKHIENDSGHYFEFSRNRGIMLLWVSHFIVRMHRMFRLKLHVASDSMVILDWFFYLDKFAGDTNESSPAISFFNTLVSGNICNGNITAAFFKESDTVIDELFTDNVAGLFNDMNRNHSVYPELAKLFKSGSIYYETSGQVA